MAYEDRRSRRKTVRSMMLCLLCGRVYLKGCSHREDSVRTGRNGESLFAGMDRVVLMKECAKCNIKQFMLRSGSGRSLIVDLVSRLSRCLAAATAVFADVDGLLYPSNEDEIFEAQDRVDCLLMESSFLDDLVACEEGEEDSEDDEWVEIPLFWKSRVDQMFGLEFLFCGRSGEDCAGSDDSGGVDGEDHGFYRLTDGVGELCLDS
jgi:hypothetical protein